MYRTTTFIRTLQPITSSTRSISTTPRLLKSTTEAVKETADSLNKTVGKTLASGLGKVQEAMGQDVDPTNPQAQGTTGLNSTTTTSTGQTANVATAEARNALKDAKEGVKKAVTGK